jgi:hypothetical protein
MSTLTHSPHVCRACGLPLVQPEEWEPEGRGWRVVLWCPSCGWSAEEVLDQETADRFDVELDRGTGRLVAACERITTLNMRDYTNRFIGALTADAVLPEDF